MIHTFIKGDKVISVILWGTLFLSVGVSNVLGPMGFNFSYFNPISHFMFGFLSRELFKIANDYYPFIDKVAAKFPKKIAKYITPATFAFVLCLSHGIMEEVQKLIPVLKSLVWTNLPDQIMDTVMDIGGITVSAKRTALFAKPKPSQVDESQLDGEEVKVVSHE